MTFADWLTLVPPMPQVPARDVVWAVLVALTFSAPAAHAAAPTTPVVRRSGELLPPADTAQRTVLDSALAAATFDSAWSTIGVSLENRGIRRSDWADVRRELRPAAALARSDSALRAVIDDMLRRLGESHFAVLPAPSARAPSAASAASAASATGDVAVTTTVALGSAGIEPRIVDGRLVVWRADSGAARRAGVEPGWILERIDGFSAPALGSSDTSGARRLALLTGALHALHGAPGTVVRLVARDAAGAQRIVEFSRDTVRGPISRFGNLPPLPAGLEFRQRTTADGRCVGIIAFGYWMPPVMPALDRAVDAARTCAGIVVDLRGNLGGVAGMVMGAAGHFVNEPRVLGAMRTRNDEMRFVANPRRVTDAGVAVEPFSGSLAILVDELSASTSEIFAAALQAIGRARVFGDRTAGQALPAVATRLPNGDVLMHVVADFVAPDGSRIEGRGVVPDERVPLDLTSVRAGRDAPLEAALRWIGRDRSSSPR